MNTTSFSARLDPLLDRYVHGMRSLGRGYLGEEQILRSFLRFLQDRAAVELDQALFDAWCHSLQGLTANGRRKRQRIVRNFCLYRRRTEPNCFVPDVHRFPRPCPYRAPVIFGPEAVARLLAAAQELSPRPASPLLPAGLRLAMVLLYTAGLRRGGRLVSPWPTPIPPRGCSGCASRSSTSPDSFRCRGRPAGASRLSATTAGAPAP